MISRRLQSTVIWLSASGLTALCGVGIANQLSTSLYALSFIAPPMGSLIALILLLGGPVAILVAGIRKRRLGMIIGPLLLIPIAAIWMTASDWSEMRTKAKYVAELDARTFTTPVTGHHLVGLEYSLSNECDQLCQLILVNSDYAVAVGGSGADRTVYRKISLAECLETQYVRNNVRFFGICATAEPVSWIDDALLIVTPSNLEAFMLFQDLYPGFDGEAYALVERRQGQDHLLGRWIAGKAQVGQFESQPIGAPFTREQFYRAALGMRLNIEDLQNSTWLWEGSQAD